MCASRRWSRMKSQALGGGLTGPHGIRDLGYGFVPENYNSYVVDNVLR